MYKWKVHLMLDPITNPFTNMKKKCFGAAEIFRSEN